MPQTEGIVPMSHSDIEGHRQMKQKKVIEEEQNWTSLLYQILYLLFWVLS